ncbi:MAG: hypothetical protein IVW51_18900 [Thermaceae bacterium]|nr:hypothetical protein [Thermaceae bacterium]
MLTQAKPIPVAFGQALALKDKLESGLSLQAAKNLKMATEVVYDLQGTPFYNLTVAVLNLPKWGKFWDVINTYDPGLKYTLYGTGASDVRSIYDFEFSNNLAEKLKAVRAVAGSYQRLVSPSGARLYLEDASGGLWEVWSAQPVPQAAVEQDKRDYQKLKKGFEDNPQLAQETKQAWKDVMGDNNAPTPPTPQSTDLVSWKTFTQTDGTLDVSGLTQTLESKGASIQRQGQGVSAQSDYKYCIGFLCTTSIFAHVLGRNDIDNYNWDNPVNDPVLNDDISYGDPWGNNQNVVYNYPYSYQPAPSGGNFTPTPFGPGTTWGMRDIAPTGIVFQPYAINGCGAQTFTRLMGWYYMNRGVTAGYGSKEALALDMNRPVQADNAPAGIYEPYISRIMGAGSYHGWQTAISPYGLFGQGGGFIAGGNAWLNERSVGRQLVGQMYFDPTGWIGVNALAPFRPLDVGFNSLTWNVHFNIRAAIHDRSEPAIALYREQYPANWKDPFGWGGHYGLIFAYKNYTNPLYVDVYAWISYREGGNPSGWVNITNRWETMGGVVSLQPPAPTPPPSGGCSNPRICG